MELNKNETTKRRTRSEKLRERSESAESFKSLKTPNLSEPDSDTSCRSASPAQWAKRRRSKEEEEDEGPSPKVPSTKRGRGRPPTTGEYVGLAKAKADLVAQMRFQQHLEAERELDVELSMRSDAKLVEGKQEYPLDPERCNLAQLHRRIKESMELVELVAKKSLNLKGTYVKYLKRAAEEGVVCSELILKHSANAEVLMLVESNNNLKGEIMVLRRRMADLERTREQPAQAAAPAPAQPNFEEMMRSVMVQVGTMMSARLAALEERLLPERRVRPPLAADLGKEARPVDAPRGLKPREAPGRGDGIATATTSEDAQPSVPEEPWTVVVSKGSKRSKKKSGPSVQPVPRPARPVRTQAAKPAKKPQPAPVKVPRLRPPRTAAVVLTLQAGAEEGGLTYAKVIAEAKEKIDLGALGVPSGIRMRTAATGAKIIEVPGAEKAALADSLANKLREVFQDPEVIKISRPVTTADIRVSGLDESIDSTELVAAVAKAGSCSVEEIKAGLIRFGAAGMGTALVRCPVAAAKQVLARGRLLVGWVSAQVKLLQPRPRRCFRCLEQGHIRVHCESEVDRSDECYRCGQKGHLANECSAAPHCTICAAANKPAEHLSGGKACAKSPGKKVRRGKRAVTGTQPQAQPSQMES